MSPEREKEYVELLAFLEFYFVNCLQLPPAQSSHALSIRAEAERIAQTYGRSKALDGTRQAVNDAIEELNDLKPDGVELLDAALRGGRRGDFD